ncbi:NUDIX domain-containing protein [Streptomyces alkaliterrae]|uniref:NUDIX domain-containing protein n=1 Tax=Streptomyces alkaliterrae TaxID=2213162 RepID=A0A5P0YXL7_9ACTN|nr:NUDIX domain-containing protein [Streptomyces alkaliterrae]MQS05028.1 NUDIX domain-containing protein [Streptomyces alkaliterrae]
MSPSPAPTLATALLVAAVIVHDRDSDRVLMLRRGPNAKVAPGSWDLPVGKNEPGEPITLSAVRELREETGLAVAAPDLRLAHVVHGRAGAEAPGGFLTVVLATTRWAGEPENREPEKHSRLAWVPIGAPPEETYAPAAEAIAGYRAGRPSVVLTGWDGMPS